MSRQQNIGVAQKLLEGIGSGRDPAEIAALFDADLVFEIQGDDGVLPWIGRRTGRQAEPRVTTAPLFNGATLFNGPKAQVRRASLCAVSAPAARP